MFWNRNKRIASLFVFILGFISFALCGCSYITLNFDKCPAARYNTQWMSEDEKILIISNETGYTYGYIDLDDERIPVQFAFTTWGGIFVNGYTSMGETIDSRYEEWSCKRYKSNSFAVKVRKSVFFSQGEKIVFHRLDDDQKIEYEPLSFSSTEGNIQYENCIDKNADIILPELQKSISVSGYSEYISHIMSLSLYRAGIKEIYDAKINTINDDEILMMVTDAENIPWYILYDRHTLTVVSVKRDL